MTMPKRPRQAPRKTIVPRAGRQAAKEPGQIKKSQAPRKHGPPPLPRDLLNSGLSEAQEQIYDGWELYSRDPRGAKISFEEAIELDPSLADAYNGLAGLASDKKRFEEAETLYRTAYEKARAALGTEDPQAFCWWGELETRPYMRARHGLGLLFLETGRYREAFAEFKDLLGRNPNDNQGARYLAAPALLLAGDLEDALGEFACYERQFPNDIPDPHFLLNWALALFLAGQFEASALRFRATIFENPYLIPFVLGKQPKTLPIRHSSNLMERDYAKEYFDWFDKLWTDRPEARRFLQFVWNEPEIKCDYWMWVDLWERAGDLEVGRERSEVLGEIGRIEGQGLTPKFLARLGEHVASHLEPPKGRVS